MAAFTEAMNAFLSKVPGCWASIVSTLAALACPARSSVGASAASWASLAFDAAGGCARLSLAKPLTLPVTWVKAGSSSGSHAARRHRRLEQLVGGQRRSAHRRGRRAPAAPACRRRRLAARGALARTACLGGLGSGLAERADRRAPAWVAAPASSGPPPPARSRSSSPRARRRRLRALELDGYAGRLGRLQTLLDRVDRRLVLAHLPAARRRCRRRPASPGNLSLAAISALTAALPAWRCRASSAWGAAATLVRAPAALRRLCSEGAADLLARRVGRLPYASHAQSVADVVVGARRGNAVIGARVSASKGSPDSRGAFLLAVLRGRRVSTMRSRMEG